MSCSNHPQWVHDSADCPMCASSRKPSYKAYTVEWEENPLKSRVILTPYGQLLLRFGIAKDLVGSATCLIGLHKQEPEDGWLDKWFTWHVAKDDSDGTRAIEARAKQLEPYLLEEHFGDCTCVPMSCMKCATEELLGVDTIKGLGKHPGSNVAGAFRDGRETLAEALHYLRTTPIKADWNGWEAHLPRWTAERDEAIEWLVQYQARKESL